jgi:hypothetical protein
LKNTSKKLIKKWIQFERSCLEIII